MGQLDHSIAGCQNVGRRLCGEESVGVSKTTGSVTHWGLRIMANNKCCATCGFLTLRGIPDPNETVVARHQFRETGNPKSTDPIAYDFTPICFRRVIDLEDKREAKRLEMQRGFTDFSLSLDTIRENGQHCDEHFPWHESLSLQEHLELQRHRTDRLWRIVCAVGGFIGGLVTASFAKLIE